VKILNNSIYLKEGIFNDSRQAILSILTTATNNYVEGANHSSIANYLEFKTNLYNENNKISGVKAFDRINKKEITIRAKIVVNCTGVFLDNNFGINGEIKNKITKIIKGTHLVFKDLNLDYAIMIPKTSDGRALTIIPYDNQYNIVGTAQNIEFDKTLMPIPTEKDEEYIFRELALYSQIKNLPKIENCLTEDNLRKKLSSKWSGYICIFEKNKISDNNNPFNNILWDHKTNLYNIISSSWSLYRKTGNTLINFIIENEPEFKDKMTQLKIDSQNLRLKGSLNNFQTKISEKEYFLEKLIFNIFVEELSDSFNLKKDILSSLVMRHGINSIKILNEGAKNKSNNIIFDNILDSEIRYLINNEMALKPNDILCRRLNIGFLNDKIFIEAIPKISFILKDELKLSDLQMKEIMDEAFRNVNSKL